MPFPSRGSQEGPRTAIAVEQGEEDHCQQPVRSEDIFLHY